jgi:glycerol-3-phosphate dehydrogenase
MLKKSQVDIAILGSGIAGLWLLNRLSTLGYSVILLETGAIGGGQTHKAQGIIHGGMKYALQGSLTSSSLAIADMPALWNSCLHGKGLIDLSQVKILSQHQYLFSTGKLAGKLTGFFANVALQGRVSALAKEQFPQVFQHSKFKGVVYALDEMALDVHTLLHALVKPHQDAIFKIAVPALVTLNNNQGIKALTIQSEQGHIVTLEAKKYIFTAGLGNELYAKNIINPVIATQRRPLHMVVVKTDFAYPVFAHCFGLSSTPRITITTHQAKDGKTIWYLGGQIAEEGVHLSAEQQCALAIKELTEIFTWLDFTKAKAASFFVDRAEPSQPGGKRPDTAYFKAIANQIIAWPTKLALAPKLADDIITTLQQEKLTCSKADTAALLNFSKPEIAIPIWDQLLC